MPTPEETTNLEVISEYFSEFWGKANPEIVEKLCADDFVINYPMHGPRHGKEAAKKMLAGFKEAFPDISLRPYQHPLIASGPYVVGRWIGGGTRTGVSFHDPAIGTLEIPNTGRKIHFSGTTIFTLSDGKIVDEIGEEGALTALQQLGLVKGPNLGKEVMVSIRRVSKAGVALGRQILVRHGVFTIASSFHRVVIYRLQARHLSPEISIMMSNVI